MFTIWGMQPWMIPYLPNDLDVPPTLHALLNSMLNYGKEEKVRVRNFASEGASLIFNFNYPLSEKVNKSDFEKMFINHFLMRRIGYETFLAWQLALEVRLNEIMPTYNKMFDMLDGWDLFKDGLTTERDLMDSRTSNLETNTTSNTTSNKTDTSDRRYSDTPQNRINDVKSGSYVTTYDYDTNISDTDSDLTSNTTTDTTDNDTQKEITKSDVSDKLKVYQDFIANRNHIYTMIFKDLECMFYQIIN